MGGSPRVNESAVERKRRYSRESRQRHYRRHRDAAVAALSEIKSVPCADCGSRFPPCAMDAILPQGRKYRVTTQPPAIIQRDLKDAMILCANCGRERAYQKVWSRYGKKKQH
jgi:hypothetical protein